MATSEYEVEIMLLTARRGTKTWAEGRRREGREGRGGQRRAEEGRGGQRWVRERKRSACH